MIGAGQILPGEQVVWQGSPYTGLVFRPIEAFLIPFSLLWGGFALFWNAMVWTAQATAPLLFKLFGIPFLIAGVYIIVGRFWIDMKLRQHLSYVVTNRRILILKNNGTPSRSLDIKRLPALELDERQDGTGTIRFGPAANVFGTGGFGIWQPTFDQTPQFIRIPGVRAVYQHIQEHAG